MSKKLKNIFKVKKLPILAGIILGIFVAIFIFGAVLNSFSGGSAIKAVSAQSVFQSSEIPQFIFVYKNQTNIFVRFFNSISNLFSSENKELSATVKILNANGDEVDGLNPQIKKEPNGKFSVDLDHSHFQQELRPGKYKMELEIKDGDKTYAQEQEFRWGVLAINTNKSIYLPNEEAYFQIASLKDDGHTICNSNLKLQIQNPKSKIQTLSTENGGIKYSGECKGDNVTNVPDYFAYYQINGVGKYEMTLTNLDNGYKITDYFEVRDPSIDSGQVPFFDVERTGPTRIWPEADYEMKIKIKANQDFEGKIVETVPMTFAVTEKTGASQKPNSDNYTKTITWNAKIKKGETKELSYSIDFPNISPYFYLIGPLKMLHATGYMFQESRQWQIAADAIGLTGMVVYAEDASLTPLYRTWSGSDLNVASASLQAAEANHGEVIRTRVVNAPNKNEYAYAAMAYDTTDVHLDVQIWNGSSWIDGTSAPTNGDFTTNLVDVGNENWWEAFDLAYEETTGDLLIVYEDTAAATDASLSYKAWDGSSWVASGSYVYPAASTGEVRWIRMAPRPNTDDILIVFSDSNSDLFSVLWDGSAMDEANDQSITTALDQAIHRGFDVAWEQGGGGQGIVAYGTGSTTINYCTHDGTTCTDGGVANAFGSSANEWLELAADPSSDYIALMATDTQTTMDLYVDMWNGADWSIAGPTAEGGVEEGDSDDVTQVFDVAWERDSSQAMFVFVDDAAVIISYFLYSVSSASFYCPEAAGTGEVVTALENAEASGGPCDVAAPTFNAAIGEPRLVPSNTNSNIMLTAYNNTGTPRQAEQMLWTGSTNLWSQTTEQSSVEGDLSPDDWTEGSTDNMPRAYDFAWEPKPVTLSGVCKKVNQSDSCSDCVDCVRVSLNGTLQTNTDSLGDISGGSWSAQVYKPATNQAVTVFLSGVANSNEAVAVAKYDGSGDMTNFDLYEMHLNIGSDNSLTVDNTALSAYDNSISTNEDIFYEASATSLQTCYISGCESAELYIKSESTFAPNTGGGSFVETHDIEIDGTFDLTGANNYASISGSWNNDSVFTANSSTIFFTASDSAAEVVSESQGSTVTFNNVQFGEDSTATDSYSAHFDLNGNATPLDVNGNLAISGGTLHGLKNINLAGNLTISANGAYTPNSSTLTFDGSTAATWTDNRAAPADMGMVSINGTTKRVVLGSSVKANELTIAASQILDLGSSGYTLTIGGDGQTTTRPLIKTGTLDCGTNSTVEYLASQSTDIENTNYFNLKLASASTTFYINGSASSITVSGSFNIDSGTFNGGDDTVTLKKTGTGVFSASGTFAPATGIINYTGDGATTIASMSDGGNTGYYSLQIGNAITQTGNRTYTIDGNTTSTYVQVGPSSGSYYHTLALSAYTLTITGTGTSFMYQDSSYGHLSADTGTVSFIGNGATDVLGDPIFWIYYNLSIGTANNANVTYTAINGNVSVQNQLSLQSAGSGYTNTFALGARNLDVGTSSITNSGTISVPIRSAITQTSGTTTLFTSDNATTPTIGGAGTTTFGDFSIANSNNIAFTFTLAGDVGASGSFNLTGHASYIHHLDFSSSNYELSVGGNFAVGQNASISARLGTVTFGGSTTSTTPNINATGKFEPYNLTINKTGTDANDNVTLASNLIVGNTLTLTDGQLIQGNYDVRAEGSSAVSIASGTDKEWTNIGTGDLVLGGTFANAGSVAFDTNDNDCSVVTDDIQITSTAGGTQRTWSGTGGFNMYNVYVQDMTRSDSPNITVYNGSSSNVTGNWTFGTCQAAPIVAQAHYRWRNDDNNEASATWKRAEDNLHSGQARSQNVRLRFSLKNTGANATGYQFGLQVAPKNSNDCSLVASSSYTPVPPAGSCGVDVACMADSTQFTSGDASTPQLTAEGTWVAGEMVDNTTSISDAITINENYYTEVEYNFQFTTYAAYGANYCFRVTNNGAPIDTYTKIAEATVEGTSLLNRLKGALRIKGGTRIK